MIITRLCRHRLAWSRTRDFHSRNTGSNPVGGAKIYKNWEIQGFFTRLNFAKQNFGGQVHVIRVQIPSGLRGIMNKEKLGQPEQPVWMAEANKRWLETDSRERQIILSNLLHDSVINNPGEIIRLKYIDLDKMPLKYAEEIARKLGFNS